MAWRGLERRCGPGRCAGRTIATSWAGGGRWSRAPGAEGLGKNVESGQGHSARQYKQGHAHFESVLDVYSLNLAPVFSVLSLEDLLELALCLEFALALSGVVLLSL